MGRSLADALAIAQDLLDTTGAAMLSGDTDTFTACFAIPTIFDTFEGQVRLDTVNDLEARFHKVCAHYQSLNMTDFVRHIVAAEWFDARTIHSTHQGRVLSGTTLMQAPFTVFSVLKHTGQRWQIAFSQYTITDAPDLNTALTGSSSTKETHND